MSLFSKHDIEDLVTRNAEESKTLEFKSTIYSQTIEGKKEFLKDVSAFANTSGGKLLIGIHEQRNAEGIGTALRADGVEAEIDLLKQQWENLLKDSCDPPINTVNIYSVDGFPNGKVIVLDVPKSWIGPHRVRIAGQSYFFLRTSSKAEVMDSREIRRAFLYSESISERMRAWRAERVSLIHVGNGQLPTVGAIQAIFHIMPLDSFTSDLTINMLDPGVQQGLPYAFEGGELPRTNFDGLIQTVMRGSPITSYSQLFRNGIFEGVTEVSNPNGSVAGEWWEKAATDYVAQCLQYLSQRVDASVYVGLSLVGCKGQTFASGGHKRNDSFDRDILVFPEIEIQDPRNVRPTEKIRSVLAQAFDVAWQSIGQRKSPYQSSFGGKF